jgi:GT2 family glycosyltransferase
MMPVMLRVSVVVPTHNRVGPLRLLLESLEAQLLTASEFEVIIVGDEGDLGQAVVQEFIDRGRLDLKFVFVPDDPWRGRSASAKRNFGAALACGPWLAFIDDDCVADSRWLIEALPFFESPENGGVEGRKTIPVPRFPTLTYRGLLLFTLPGGYQTANMFYRRSVFSELGGFDTAFPFYLEDTDLAWSVLDRGLAIPHAEQAAVAHPVPPAEPMRLLANARRAVLVPYLYKKHRKQFRASGMRTIVRSHVPYLACYALLVAASASEQVTWAAACLAALGLLTLAHTTKLFWKCRFTARELLLTAAMLPLVPMVTVVQLIRGNLRNHVLLLR